MNIVSKKMVARTSWLWRRLKQKIAHKCGIYYRRSYSQNGEDMIARGVFDALNIGVPSYVDIGAHHPFYLNNTYGFYREGSRGLNVEADPALLKAFKKWRTGDVNLNIGIGPVAGVLKLFIMNVRTLNTFSEMEALSYEAQGIPIIKQTDVNVITIDQLFDEYNKGIAPDFLSIDVEGLDFDILRSLNMEKYRPALVCTETVAYSTNGMAEKCKGIDELFCNCGYVRYADTHINTLYVDKEKWIKR